MKGVKMTLDTKVQPNLLTRWRDIGGYDKSVDAIVLHADEGSVKDKWIDIPNPVVGEVYTISFDAWGSTKNNKITIHCIPLGLKDNGHVDWYNLSQKSKRYFTTYRLVERANSFIIRGQPGTTYIRNIKLEKSPYPTDYEE